MLNIAFYVAEMKKSGAERATLNISQYLGEKGCNSYIITSIKGKADYVVPSTVRHICVGSFNFLKLRKILKKHNINILVIMGVPFCIYSIPATFFLRTKVIVSERNAPAQFAGKMTTKLLSRFLMRFSDGYVFQTKDAKDFYKKMLHGKGTVIPNPLYCDGFPQVVKYVDRANCVVNIGRLTAQKNQTMLIEAFSLFSKNHPDYSLTIYGEGDGRKLLENLIENLGLQDKVSMPGNVYDIHERVCKAKIFALSSDYEGMPNALMEAMALGIPSISTDCPCGGPKELIENKVNGLLTPVGDIKAMSSAMCYLAENDEQAELISSRSIHIREQLEVSKICKKWEDYINQTASDVR